MTTAEWNKLRRAFQRGVEILDEKRPRWREQLRVKVNRIPLDIWSSHYCVLGHLYGSYEKGLIELLRSHESGFDYGFQLYTVGRLSEGWLIKEKTYLEKLWLKEMEKENTWN